MDELIEHLGTVPDIRPNQQHEVAVVLLRMADQHFSPAVKKPLFAVISDTGGILSSDLKTSVPRSGIEAMMSGAIRNVLGVTDPLVSTLAALKATGLDSNQALLAGRAFLQFVSEKAGGDVVRQMTIEIPGLSRLN